MSFPFVSKSEYYDFNCFARSTAMNLVKKEKDIVTFNLLVGHHEFAITAATWLLNTSCMAK